jgi:DNA adenine methylase
MDKKFIHLKRDKMKRNALISPVVKWVGGKRQLLPVINNNLPKNYNYYCEPFLGGGAVLFNIQPKKAIVNDLNSELMNVYKVIKTNVDELLLDLKKHKNESDYFYKMRELDRDKKKYDELTNIEKASRILYLNKTCFNGLFRVNNAGEFNTPFGRYKNPNIVNDEVLNAVNYYFNDAEIIFYNNDYKTVLESLKKNSFVYLDPPYDPVSDTSSFTGYNKGGFNRKEQIRLKKFCDALNDKGIKFLLSNSATDFIKKLYKEDYNLQIVKAKRSINSVSSRRGQIDEILVKNYEN